MLYCINIGVAKAAFPAFSQTDSAERSGHVARQIESGKVPVNNLGHDPKAPFGGFKHSGIGREMGEWGIKAFLEPKAILEGHYQGKVSPR